MAVLWIRRSLSVEMCGLQIVIKQIANHVIREQLHTAIGMMDDKPLASSEELVRNDQRANGIVALRRPALRIT